MARPAIDLAGDFISHLNYLEFTRTKVERLLCNGAIVRRDIEQVYTGLYLDAITSFENVVEDLFIGLLVGRITLSSSQVIPRVTFKSNQVARDVVFGGRHYVDWLPYHYTEQRAKAFFRNGLPFANLGDADKKALEQALYVRNAVVFKPNGCTTVLDWTLLLISSSVVLQFAGTGGRQWTGCVRLDTA